MEHESHEAALQFAYQIIYQLEDDNFPVPGDVIEAVDIKWLWMNGEASDADMEAAQYRAKVAHVKQQRMINLGQWTEADSWNCNKIRWIVEALDMEIEHMRSAAYVQQTLF